MKRRESRASTIAATKKKEEMKEEEQNQKAKLASKGAKALKMGFGKLNGKFKVMMQSKEQKFNEEAAKHSNLIFNELSKFVMHFCNMALPFDQANELLIYFCNVY